MLFRNALGTDVLLRVLTGSRFLEANAELYSWLSALVVDSYCFEEYNVK